VEYSIQQVVDAAGVTSRTLRHYDAIGLLPAHRTPSGYRCYRQMDLVRLQRILLLRDMGMGLSEIAEVLDGQTDDTAALNAHLDHLRQESRRLQRQIAAVERTIARLKNQEKLMADDMFDGFDHTQYRQEVEERWGEQAYADGDRWWRSSTGEDKRAYLQEHESIAAAWAHARAQGLPVDSDEVQQIAARHTAWITIGWQGRSPSAEALVGLAEMYVADERFAANYGGVDGAAFVRDGLVAYSRTL
jgi:DNA-binding transcriptional MerR regulator